MNFYPAPPTIKASLYVKIPNELRCAGRETEWRGGFARKFQDIFLEGPVADQNGNLYVVDVPYGRILRVDGLTPTADGDLLVADYKQV